MADLNERWAPVAQGVRGLEPTAVYSEVRQRLEDICAACRQRDFLARIDFTPMFIHNTEASRSRFEIRVGNTASRWSLEDAGRAIEDFAMALRFAYALDALLSPWEYDHDNKGIAVRAPRFNVAHDEDRRRLIITEKE